MRLVLLAGLGTAVALIGTASATVLTTRHESTAGTSIHLYAPFNGAGVASGIHIRKTTSGYCWTTSIADPRGDAFRCDNGYFIYDPCFSDQTGFAKFVLCPLYTPRSKVLRINLTKQLPPNPGSGDPTRHAPWAVQIARGEWCEFLTGSTGQIAGMRINYRCAGGGLLIGNPRRSSSVWTIFYAPTARTSQYQPVEVKSAWW
jgi:hypothetical protein